MFKQAEELMPKAKYAEMDISELSPEERGKLIDLKKEFEKGD